MTTETINEINKTIAEACGWVKIYTDFQGNLVGRHPNGGSALILLYWQDLNACRKMLMALSDHPMDGDVANYHNYLISICGDEYAAIDATAPQRCQAIISALFGHDKWEELTK